MGFDEPAGIAGIAQKARFLRLSSATPLMRNAETNAFHQMNNVPARRIHAVVVVVRDYDANVAYNTALRSFSRPEKESNVEANRRKEGNTEFLLFSTISPRLLRVRVYTNSFSSFFHLKSCSPHWWNIGRKSFPIYFANLAMLDFDRIRHSSAPSNRNQKHIRFNRYEFSLSKPPGKTVRVSSTELFPSIVFVRTFFLTS